MRQKHRIIKYRDCEHFDKNRFKNDLTGELSFKKEKTKPSRSAYQKTKKDQQKIYDNIDINYQLLSVKYLENFKAVIYR